MPKVLRIPHHRHTHLEMGFCNKAVPKYAHIVLFLHNKRSKITFVHERLEMGQEMDVYELG